MVFLLVTVPCRVGLYVSPHFLLTSLADFSTLWSSLGISIVFIPLSFYFLEQFSLFKISSFPLLVRLVSLGQKRRGVGMFFMPSLLSWNGRGGFCMNAFRAPLQSFSMTR